MFRKSILPIVITTLIISCNNAKEPADDEATIENVDEPITKGKGKKVTDRD